MKNQQLENTGVSVVVPVYRSAFTIAELCERITAVLSTTEFPYEILLIEDGAKDNTWDIVEALVQTNEHIKGIRLSRNYGQHNALLCGIRAARYLTIVTIDDDLQHPPEEIPKLLAELQKGYDVVYGTPEREQHNFWRDQASRITKIALQSAMGAQTARNVSAFRAFRSPLREAFIDYRSPFVSIDVLLTWGTTRFGHIVVRHEPRSQGESNYTFLKLLNHAMNMMTGFSTLPLQIASMVGFIFTLLGIGIFFYVILRYFLCGDAVPGFPFLASIIALFSGAQLFAIGVVGEYLARMHFRAMERPVYCIAEKTEGSE